MASVKQSSPPSLILIQKLTLSRQVQFGVSQLGLLKRLGEYGQLAPHRKFSIYVQVKDSLLLLLCMVVKLFGHFQVMFLLSSFDIEE